MGSALGQNTLRSKDWEVTVEPNSLVLNESIRKGATVSLEHKDMQMNEMREDNKGPKNKSVLY